MDPYTILPHERAMYLTQFNSLKPMNGQVSGDQAKGFLLQSQLPPPVLGLIWDLADMNVDGMLNFTEFSVACKLINLKLRGFELPKTVPPSLLSSASNVAAAPQPVPVYNQPLVPASGSAPLIPGPVNPVPLIPLTGGPSAVPLAAVPSMGGQLITAAPINQQVQLLIQPVVPLAAAAPPLVPGFAPLAPAPQGLPKVPVPLQQVSSLDNASKPGTPDSAKMFQRNASVASKDSPVHQEWAVPHQTKLKYTQVFNSHDRSKTGFLTGVQARGILMQSQLPQAILAHIWGLSDVDSDGRLSCDEFVLAMHLCDLATKGEKLPATLPPELYPPTLRRQSITAVIGTPPALAATTTAVATLDSAAAMPLADDLKFATPASFEDKRKENFEKGQAELEKRRRALAELQRKEQEERERKEREEQERREKLRQEQERRRLAELEKQLAKQREIEMEKEEQRRKLLEQREAARREMERQRQLEWQKQRMQELQNQKQKEMEKLASLRAIHANLCLELDTLNEKATEVSSKIVETRTGVAEVKSTIDGMRTTRDTQMAQLSTLKTKLRDQNQRLLTVSQEKAKLEAKNRINAAATPDMAGNVALIQSIAARQAALTQMKEKLEEMQNEISLKLQDADNNNAQLSSMKKELSGLAKDCRETHAKYLGKRQEVLELRARGGSKTSWDSEWTEPARWDSEPRFDNQANPVPVTANGVVRYRALYEFVARNNDEVSFQPGDIILVTKCESNEPGWLSGEVRGASGWFPEAYVERIDSDWAEPAAVGGDSGLAAKRHALEGIQELPENVSDNGSIVDSSAIEASAFNQLSPKLNTEDPFAAFGSSQPVPETTNNGGFTQPLGQSAAGDEEMYVAMYPYESTEPGDLVFSAGEMIKVVKKDGDWWTGVIGERSGVFPSNYVQKAELQFEEAAADNEVEAATAAAAAAATFATSPTQGSAAFTQSGKRPNTAPIESEFESAMVGVPRAASAASSGAASPSVIQGRGKKPEIATVIAPYSATSAEQLSLQRGQLIMIRKKSASGWWEGELQAKGRKRQIGWFPASYVKILSSTGSSRTTPVPLDDCEIPESLEPFNTAPETTQHPSDQVVALFPYTAQNEDELSFLQGDVIKVVDKEDPAWWKGELKGNVGLFPSNYVEAMGSLAAAAALDAAAAANANSTTSPQWAASAAILAKLTNEERQRQTAIFELISTEESYMEDMTVVVEAFMKPLNNSGLVKMEDLDTIFVNWKDLLICNNTLLRAFRIRKKMSPDGIIQMVGDVMCEHLPHMSPYIRFCSRQLDSASLIQRLFENRSDFRELLKKCQSSHMTRGMPLTSFMLKPMQRITKYPLLLKKILEFTQEDHPDRLHVEEALAKAEELCNQVNEGVREQENSERLEWLQRRVQVEGLDERLIFHSLTNILGPRKLIHYGGLRKAKSGKEILTFLFNDFVLFTQPSKSLASINMQFLFDKKSNLSLRLYRKPMFLNEMLVSVESPGSSEAAADSENPHLRFSLQSLNYVMLVSAASPAEKTLWMRKLEEARKNYLAVERSILQRQNSKQRDGQLCGRLLVVVIEAANLQPITPQVRQRPPQGKMRIIIVEGIGLVARDIKGKSDPYCEVSMGSQEHRTKVIPGTLNPKWNASMQFVVKDLRQDVLCVTVFDKDYFSPNEFMGRTELRIADIYEESKIYRGPLIKKLPLYEVDSGEIVIKVDLQLFHKN